MKVFLMSDSELLRTELRRLLDETADLSVVGAAPCRRETLPLLALHSPNVVVLALDPRSGGCAELMLLIRGLGFAARLLVISDIADPAFRSLCLAAGADGFIDSSRAGDALAAAVLDHARRPMRQVPRP